MNKRYVTELEEIFNGDEQTAMEGSGSYPSPAQTQAAMQRGRYMRAVAFSVAISHLLALVLALFNRIVPLSRLPRVFFPHISSTKGSKHTRIREFQMSGDKPECP